MFRTIKWTKHAEGRLEKWGLEKSEVESALRREHRRRRPNKGKADWRIAADLSKRAARLTVLYDYCEKVDPGVARIVTVWTDECL
jgi:hypothetical protein